MCWIWVLITKKEKRVYPDKYPQKAFTLRIWCESLIVKNTDPPLYSIPQVYPGGSDETV